MTLPEQSPMAGETFWHRRFGPVLGGALAFAFEVFRIVVISLAIIWPIRHFLAQPFYVKGASMENTFYDHEYLIIDELSYRLHDPARGEIIVFRYPRDPSEFFIKRVVGLPGEEVEVANGYVTVFTSGYPDGIVLEEPYLGDAYTPGYVSRVQLGPDEYFVLGDNRDASLDSRVIGAIKRDAIVGRVWLRGLPLSRIAVFDTPGYNL
ncbi:signal peptidase I [Candidatus Uhrbacteria bacterium]|nr:signal peptidase I [Candidatus Uhrbacteria bacterium]